MKKKTLSEKVDTFSQQLIAECWSQMWKQSDFVISMDLIHIAVKFRSQILALEQLSNDEQLDT